MPTSREAGEIGAPAASSKASISAMPKLPARPATAKKAASTTSPEKQNVEFPNSATSDSTGVALTSSAAQPSPSGSHGDGGGSSCKAAAPTSSSPASTSAAAPPGPQRPTAGPSLPPRTARNPLPASASASANTSNSDTTRASTAATPSAPTAAQATSTASEAASPPPPPPPSTAKAASTAAAPSSAASKAAAAAATGDSKVPAQQQPTAAASGGGAGSSVAASPSGSGAGGGSGGGSTPTPTPTPGTSRKAPSGGLSALPPRGGVLPLPAQGPVLDPDEPESIAEVRRSIHAVRVQMISAAMRLGYDHENALVKQVLYRLALAERLKAPWRRPGKRPDPVAAAAREATRKMEEARAGAAGPGAAAGSAPAPAPLGFTVKIMLIGLQGSGKTQLAHALLGASSGPQLHTAVHPFEGATRHVTVLRGSAQGIGLEFIDTPGLLLAPGGAARNCQVLQQIRRAYQAHRPDLLMYVDRLDAPTPPAGPGAGPGGAGAELAVLRNLTAALGRGLWLNTIVAFTHAGSPPPSGARGPQAPHPQAPSARPGGPGGGLTYESWLEVRSHALQQVIRQASEDERLMNPVAFTEGHPSCPTNTAGQPVLYNGMPWRTHVLLMVTSAKLLADTEALLHKQGGGGVAGAGAAGAGGLGGGGGGGGSAAALREIMSATRQVPMSYIMQQVTQISRPLKFPDHRNVMDVRRARHEVARLQQPRQRREAARQVALRVLGLRQAVRKQRAMAEAYRQGTLAGCKVTPEPPRVATRCRPSTLPPEGFRYRALEAQGGWVVRPQVESHCADVSDGVEGFILNKVAVAAPGRAGEDDGLLGYGVPYHHSVSAQFTKDQRLLAARSEATVYHDPLGRATTSLSADLQTNSGAAGGGAGGDVLAVLRADTRLRGSSGSSLPKVTLGAIAARVGEEAQLGMGPMDVRVPLPLRGPTALGLRLQATKKIHLGAAEQPVRLAMAAAALQKSSELASGRLGLGLGRGGAGGGGDDACLGGSAEMEVDLAELLDLPLPRGLPAALGASMMRSPDGTLSAFLTTNVQYRLGAREMVAVRTNWDKRGRAGVSLRLKTVSGWWAGLVAMLVPLGRLALDSGLDAVRALRARRKLRMQQQQQKKQQQQQQQQQQQKQLQQKKKKKKQGKQQQQASTKQQQQKR